MDFTTSNAVVKASLLYRMVTRVGNLNSSPVLHLNARRVTLSQSALGRRQWQATSENLAKKSAETSLDGHQGQRQKRKGTKPTWVSQNGILVIWST